MGLAPSQSNQPTNAPGRRILGSKMSAAALMKVFTVLTFCLILLMIWESTGLAVPRFADNSPGRQQIVNFPVGNNGRASAALWYSAARLHESGEGAFHRTETQLIRESDVQSDVESDVELDVESDSAEDELEMSHRQALSHGDGGGGLGSELQPLLLGGRESAVDQHPVTALEVVDGTNRTARSGSAEFGEVEELAGGSDFPMVTSGSEEFAEAQQSWAGRVNFSKDVASVEGRDGAALAKSAAGEDGREDAGAIAVASVSSERCDFSKGEWVEDTDPRRPYYSGRECKAYIDEGFACRLTNRPNFDYEKFRWQPEGCELPSFSSDQFLERMRNKVVAMVGDSLGRQQFQSLMCMLTAGKPDARVQNVRKAWGHEVNRAYRFRHTNTTIVFYWSAPLCDIEEDRHDGKTRFAAMHLERPPAFLQKHFHQMHVLVMNTGHHWSRGKWEENKWRPYLNGQPVRDKKLVMVGESMNFTVHKVVEWIDTQLAAMDAKDAEKPAARRSNKPVVFMRTMSPRHFQNGDWNSGGTCDNTEFVSKSTVPSSPARPFHGPIKNQIAEIAVKGTRLNLLNITHLSQFRREGHISKYGIGRDSSHQDCLHWCLPGVPDVWNEILYGELVSHPNFSLS